MVVLSVREFNVGEKDGSIVICREVKLEVMKMACECYEVRDGKKVTWGS